MGAAAITTSGFAINRERVAELLGFAQVQENSYDSIGGADFILEYANALQLAAIDLGKMTFDLLSWATQEYGILKVDDAFIQVSSIMMKKGQGAKALGYATVSSAIGGSVGALLLIFVSPLAVRLSLLVRTPGKFSLVLFALVTMVVISKDKRKGIITMVFGLVCSTIGIDKLKTVSRFTFGFPQLIEGIDTTTLIVGAFAISEVLAQSTVDNRKYQEMVARANGIKFKRKDFFPSCQAETSRKCLWDVKSRAIHPS